MLSPFPKKKNVIWAVSNNWFEKENVHKNNNKKVNKCLNCLVPKKYKSNGHLSANTTVSRSIDLT